MTRERWGALKLAQGQMRSATDNNYDEISEPAPNDAWLPKITVELKHVLAMLFETPLLVQHCHRRQPWRGQSVGGRGVRREARGLAVGCR